MRSAGKESSTKSAQIYHIEDGKHEQHKTKCEELIFPLKFNKIITDPRGHRPPSFILIGMKTKSYSCLIPKLEMQNKILESGKEPQPSSVIFMCPSKRLNDYYAPRA
jgi:hypothetical protein